MVVAVKVVTLSNEIALKYGSSQLEYEITMFSEEQATQI
jgi:hypothetical protein